MRRKIAIYLLFCISLVSMWGQSISVWGATSPSDLLITEIMYNPLGADEAEFLEIKNVGSVDVNLTSLYFSNGITYTFHAGAVLPSNNFFVLAKDPLFFAATYGFSPDNSIGYTGSLNNNGERITLSQADGTTLFSVNYNDAGGWPVAADGNGFSLVPKTPNANPDPDNPDNWRASHDVNGSPRADDPDAGIPPILINELLAHTDEPQIDWVELYNPTTNVVNIGNWYLTDDSSDPTRYRIPAGTTIPANGYLTFNQNQLGFNFSSLGEEVFVYSGNGTGLTGYSHGFSFDATQNGVSLGRYVTHDGQEDFTAQPILTPNAANVDPLVGPVVISEIMYNPAGTGVEYIELTNITNAIVPLYHPDEPSSSWQVQGIRALGSTLPYQLPADEFLFAHARALIVGTAPNTFRATYHVPTNIKIFGPFDGGLNNGGERLILQKPDYAEPDGFVPYLTVDMVRYDDDPPWATSPDGGGDALVRIFDRAYGNDSTNWNALTDWDTWAVASAVHINQQNAKATNFPTLFIYFVLGISVVTLWGILQRGYNRNSHQS